MANKESFNDSLKASAADLEKQIAGKKRVTLFLEKEIHDLEAKLLAIEFNIITSTTLLEVT